MNRSATDRAGMVRTKVASLCTKATKNVQLIFIFKPKNTVAVKKELFYMHRRIKSIS